MALYAYTRGAAPVRLVGLPASPTIPGSLDPPTRGQRVNVTSWLHGLSFDEYAAIEAQRAAALLDFQWTEQEEYALEPLKCLCTKLTLAIHDVPHPESFLASGAVSGHRGIKVTTEGVTYCDAMTLGDQEFLVGISTTAAAEGQPILFLNEGKLIEPSWSWTPGLPIYCGPNGVLTQTHDPSWAFVVIVAVAINATTVWIRIQPAIVQ